MYKIKIIRTDTYKCSKYYTMNNYHLLTTRNFSDKENPCTPNYCYNGGLCKPDEDGNAKCECPAGFEGEHCETSKCLTT